MNIFYEKQYDRFIKHGLENWIQKKGEGVAYSRCIKIIEHLSSQERYTEAAHVVDILSQTKLFTGEGFVEIPVEIKQLRNVILNVKAPKVVNTFFSYQPYITPNEKQSIMTRSYNIHLFNYCPIDPKLFLQKIHKFQDQKPIHEMLESFYLPLNDEWFYSIISSGDNSTQRMQLLRHMLRRGYKPNSLDADLWAKLISNSYFAKEVIPFIEPISYQDVIRLKIGSDIDVLVELYRSNKVLPDATPLSSIEQLSIYCLRGQTKDALETLKKEINPFEKSQFGSWSPFYIASGMGNLEVVKQILMRPDTVQHIDKSMSFNESTVLAFACSDKYPEIAKLLVENGANPFIRNKRERSPFYYACEQGLTEVVSLMLTHEKAFQNTDQFNQSIIAAGLQGHWEIVNLLFRHGADPFFQRQDKKSAFELAVSAGVNEIVQLFLSHRRASQCIDQPLSNRLTALQFASAFFRDEMVLLLLACGANPFLQDRKKKSPFFNYCVKGKMNVVAVMLKHPEAKKNIDQANTWQKCTALLVATANRQLDLAKLLLESGANPFAKNSSNTTPFTIALYNSPNDLLKMFIKPSDYSEMVLEVEYVPYRLRPYIDLESKTETMKEFFEPPKKFLLDKESVMGQEIDYFKNFLEQNASTIVIKLDQSAEVMEKYRKYLMFRTIIYSDFKDLAKMALYLGDRILIEELRDWLKLHPDVENWKKHLPPVENAKKFKLESL